MLDSLIPCGRRISDDPILVGRIVGLLIGRDVVGRLTTLRVGKVRDGVRVGVMRLTDELPMRRELLERLLLPNRDPTERLLPKLRPLERRLLELRLPPNRLPACISATAANTIPIPNTAATRFLLKRFMVLSFSFRGKWFPLILAQAEDRAICYTHGGSFLRNAEKQGR